MVFAVSGCVSIFAFASSLVIGSSAVGLQIYTITAGIKICKTTIKKKKKKHNKIVLLEKNKFFIEFLISKALSNSHIDHEKFISVNNVLREYNEMKKETKNPKNSVEYTMKNY